MSTSTAFQVKPLDEAAWQAWLAKGRAQERRSRAGFVIGGKCISIAVLLTAAALWTYLAPYEIVVRFVVAVGAMVVICQAYRARYYSIVAVFGVVALLYNPLGSSFGFSSDELRAVMVASAVLFAVSLAWGNYEDGA